MFDDLRLYALCRILTFPVHAAISELGLIDSRALKPTVFKGGHFSPEIGAAALVWLESRKGSGCRRRALECPILMEFRDVEILGTLSKSVVAMSC